MDRKLVELELALQEIFPVPVWHHTMKYLLTIPGTTVQHIHTDHQEGEKFVFFGGLEEESTLLVFSKKEKALKKVTYLRGQVLIIKSTAIHSGWYNDTDKVHYRIFYDVGRKALSLLGHQDHNYYTLKELKDQFAASEDLDKEIGESQILKPLYDEKI